MGLGGNLNLCRTVLEEGSYDGQSSRNLCGGTLVFVTEYQTSYEKGETL